MPPRWLARLSKCYARGYITTAHEAHFQQLQFSLALQGAVGDTTASCKANANTTASVTVYFCCLSQSPRPKAAAHSVGRKSV